MRTNEASTANLIDRYVYAVTKRLPKSERADIEQELRDLIEDMLAARVGDKGVSQGAVIDLLTELGRPEVFAARYEDGSHYLIGPELYEDYMLLIKIVLAAVSFGLSLAALLGAFTAGSFHLWQTIGQLVGMLMMGLSQAFAWVTIVFVIMQRNNKGASLGLAGEWDPSCLPELPSPPQMEIKRREPVAAVVFILLTLVAFNFAPHLLGVYAFTNGVQVVPVFNLAALDRALPLLNLAFLLGIGREIFRFLEGRYTMRLAAGSLVLNAAGLTLMVSVFGRSDIWNPGLVGELATLYGSSAADLQAMIMMFPRFFLGVVVFALVLDTAVTLYRARQSQRDA